MKTLKILLAGWLRGRAEAARGPRRAPRARPRLEYLEGRLAPALLTVTSAADAHQAGLLTLREAVALANTDARGGQSDTIAFDASLGTATITLRAGQLELSGASSSATETIGGGGRITISGNNASRVLQVDAGVQAALAGLTITQGSATSGGGISSAGSSVTLSDCTLSGNQALGTHGTDGAGGTGGVGSGGGLYVAGGSVTIEQSTLSANQATGGGGGAAHFNPVSHHYDGLGGAGGAGFGGGIYVAGGTVAVNQSTLSADHLSGGFGGPGIGDGPAGAGSGGGIYVVRGTVTVSSSTFAGNSVSGFNGAEAAGGGINNQGTLTVSSSTFTGNYAGTFGGGIYNAGTLTVSNTIVAGNTAPAGPDLSGPVDSRSSYNLIGNGSRLSGISDGVNGNLVGTAASPINPHLGPLGDYGGPTQTMAVRPGSPAIGAGDPTGAPDWDQRGPGFPRVVNGTIDIGAFEAQARGASTLHVTSLLDAGVGSGLSGDLRYALNQVNTGPGGDTIVFDVSGTIALDRTLPALAADVDVRGPGAGSLTISGNHAVGVLTVNLGVTAHLADVTIADGSTSNGGGGIYNGGTLTVSSSTITGNSANYGGGGIYNSSTGTLTVTSSTFSGNRAGDGGGGGGIANDGTLTVTSSTFSGNSAAGGGGISNGGTLTVTSSTFSGNSAYGGGGISNGGTLTVSNSIVAGNTGTHGVGPDILGGVDARSSYNLIGDGTSLTGISDGVNGNHVGTAASPLDPRLAPLGNYGGPTQTFALLPGSPARAAADPALAGADQRGFPLPAAGPGDAGAFQTQADPFRVTTAADPGGLPGLLALREAVNLANALPGNDTVTFDAGLAGSTISLTAGALELRGSGGTEAIAGGGLIALSGHTSDRVLVVDAAVTASLSGLALTNGLFATDPTAVCGGVDNFGTLTLSNCTLSYNVGASRGGAVANAGTLTVSGCTLLLNFAYGAGGGVDNAGALTVAASTLSGNGTFGSGGDLENRPGATATVTGSTLSSGYAAVNGGGVDNAGTLTLATSTLAGSYVLGDGSGLASSGTLTVVGCTFSGNAAGGNGGGLLVTGGSAALSNSTVAGNSCGGQGGGLYAASGSAADALALTNVTVALNYAGGSGGGLFVAAGAAAAPLLRNTLVASNASGPGSTADDVTGALDGGGAYNLVGAGDGLSGISDGLNGNMVGSAASPLDPVLGPLQDNGGPTQTMAVLAGSPARGGGSTDYAADTDQRGLARVVGGLIDIGAFQTQDYGL